MAPTIASPQVSGVPSGRRLAYGNTGAISSTRITMVEMNATTDAPCSAGWGFNEVGQGWREAMLAIGDALRESSHKSTVGADVWPVGLPPWASAAPDGARSRPAAPPPRHGVWRSQPSAVLVGLWNRS
ncbi:hypothetical protein BN381_450014 [Candidatus Microthrix parvicella RN1]|uniref:Uncharacterized protein n=1 Tax=Candidatus Neomicrothrix parvicella RN1 TaxID=1229780 RepID=R4Z1V1_9ACTN|nr:hypothetical protein BN381_450014 [Candidatus Microthrix parvicella RN1]